jgi:hypothetical protein
LAPPGDVAALQRCREATDSCSIASRPDMRARASACQRVENAQVRAHIAEVHQDMPPEQASEILAQGAYDE